MCLFVSSSAPAITSLGVTCNAFGHPCRLIATARPMLERLGAAAGNNQRSGGGNEKAPRK